MSERCEHGARLGQCDDVHPTPNEMAERLRTLEELVLGLYDHHQNSDCAKCRHSVVEAFRLDDLARSLSEQ